MRTLTIHIVNGCNELIQIEVVDQPGSGGANHCYVISGFDKSKNPSNPGVFDDAWILFQNGPISEVGVNGVTNEALLAILPARGVAVRVIPRKTIDGAPISASRVRALWRDGRYAEIAPLVPESTLCYIKEHAL